MQLPPTPPVDPDNEEFVLFIRATKFPQWYPLSVVKGGAQANVLLRAMQNDLGQAAVRQDPHPQHRLCELLPSLLHCVLC